MLTLSYRFERVPEIREIDAGSESLLMVSRSGIRNPMPAPSSMADMSSKSKRPLVAQGLLFRKNPKALEIRLICVNLEFILALFVARPLSWLTSRQVDSIFPSEDRDCRRLREENPRWHRRAVFGSPPKPSLAAPRATRRPGQPIPVCNRPGSYGSQYRVTLGAADVKKYNMVPISDIC